MNAPITTGGFTLAPWQQDAVAAWCAGTEGRRYHGTLEVFTGGGKTLLALTGIARVSAEVPNLRVAVIVPTVPLAQQWVDAFVQYTDVPEREIGVLGAGRKGSFGRHRVIVGVINGAAKRLPAMAADAQPLMLVVDECHRAGAPTFSKVLATPSDYRMGLSATPDREELSRRWPIRDCSKPGAGSRASPRKDRSTSRRRRNPEAPIATSSPSIPSRSA